MVAQTPTASVMESEEGHQLPLARLSLLGLGLCVITGLGAVQFRGLIGLIHNLLFAGHAVAHYDVNLFAAPAPWEALVILVPVLRGCGPLVWLVRLLTSITRCEVGITDLALRVKSRPIVTAVSFETAKLHKKARAPR